MAFEITDFFVKQYTHNVELLLQQKQSMFMPYVVNANYQGESAQVVKQFGDVEFNEKAQRHADTAWSDIEHKQRWIFPTDYTLSLPVDKEDELRMLDSPLSPYAEAMRAAWARKIDDVIIAAALGTNYTGKNGSTSTAFDSNNVIAVNSTGLTVDKLRAARKLLKQNLVDPNEPLYLAADAQAVDDLLGVQQVQDINYNSIKALVQGEVDTFMGFKFIQTERLTKDTNGDRQIIAWAHSGLAMGTWNGLEGRVTERADKEYTIQVFMRGTIAATRTQEGKVISIACSE